MKRHYIKGRRAEHMGKKILIICNYFAPDNEIAAVRLTKFAKYLSESGYLLTVIAENRERIVEDSILREEINGIQVKRISNSDRAQKRLFNYKKLIEKIKKKKYDNLENRMKFNKNSGKYEFYPFETAHPIIGSLDYLAELYRQYDLYKEGKSLLKQEQDYDVCLTSYGGYFGLFSGAYLKKKRPDYMWILDIRDPICRNKFTPRYVRGIARRFEKKACLSADTVISVTEHMCKYYQKYNCRSYCITNGFDWSDRRDIIRRRLQESKLCFAYTGSMYGGLMNLSIVFECIKELDKEKKLHKERLEFHFAGRESAYPIFNSQAQKYGMGNLCVNHGRLTRKEALQLQSDADILLAAAWDYTVEAEGIITGKILEYMSAQRPVIMIINGDVSNNEAAEIVRNCKLGAAYEQSHHEEDKQALKQFIYMKYCEYIEKGELSFTPNLEGIGAFDYKRLTDKLIKVIEKERER